MIIDKQLNQNYLILEKVIGSDNILRLTPQSTGKSLDITLGSDLSFYPRRNSYFILYSESYSNLNTGLYNYELLSNDVSVTSGVIRVLDALEFVPNVYVPSNDNDGFRYLP